MKTNDAMRRLVGDVGIRGLGIDDVPDGLRSVLERGWTATGDGAYLLRGFLDGYVGDLRHLYLVDPGAKKVTDELVDIFDPAPYEAVTTYAEQRKAFFAFTGMTDSGWQMPR
ncbi:hypothetical protein [Streptomyces xiamenensis]|uniref:hypothetical protein n=1 Tax=Streptomyces xiamenensis TaxID=408015 RepID=UPI0037D93E2D